MKIEQLSFNNEGNLDIPKNAQFLVFYNRKEESAELLIKSGNMANIKILFKISDFIKKTYGI